MTNTQDIHLYKHHIFVLDSGTIDNERVSYSIELNDAKKEKQSINL
jgi:hypothetical protein